eukprot:1455031-Rhodomonas_salina.1
MLTGKSGCASGRDRAGSEKAMTNLERFALDAGSALGLHDHALTPRVSSQRRLCQGVDASTTERKRHERAGRSWQKKKKKGDSERERRQQGRQGRLMEWGSQRESEAGREKDQCVCAADLDGNFLHWDRAVDCLCSHTPHAPSAPRIRQKTTLSPYHASQSAFQTTLP